MVLFKLPVFFLLTILVHVYALRFVRNQFQKPHFQVGTESGIVQGTKLKSNAVKKGYYYAYLGIPYAEPPVGDRRFRAPIWVRNWSGVLDASREESKCVELLLDIKGKSEITGSEDCLFLNVFTQTNPINIKQLKPVMVYIHGGAFWFGSSDLTKYGPDLLVSKDVVVVTFNYRLNIFGSLSTEDLASPGNYFLKDQNLALRWVQKNIKYFGGDPNNVLLFGQSAGAASVNLHMLSPKSRGLFHKVILQSGTALCLWGSQRKPRNIAYLVGAANGITNPKSSEDLVDRLRKVDLETLKGTLLPIVGYGMSVLTVAGLPFSSNFEPDHEGAFLTKNYFYEMFERGQFNQVPVLMGVTMNESLYMYRELKILQPVFGFIDLDSSLIAPISLNLKDENLKRYLGEVIKEKFLGKSKLFATTPIEKLLKYINEEWFLRPIWKTADLMSRHVPLYFYEFLYEGKLGRLGLGEERDYPGVRGVAHEEDLFYVFNKLNNPPEKKSDDFVRESLLIMWTNFAKYSNPTPPNRKGKDILGDLIWPTYTSNGYELPPFLEIKESLKIRNISQDTDDIIWWDEMFRKYGNRPFHTY